MKYNYQKIVHCTLFKTYQKIEIHQYIDRGQGLTNLNCIAKNIIIQMFSKKIQAGAVNQKLKSIANIQRQILIKTAAKSESRSQKCTHSSSALAKHCKIGKQGKQNSDKTVIKSKNKHKHKPNKIKSVCEDHQKTIKTTEFKQHGGQDRNLSDQIEQIRKDFHDQNNRLKGFMNDFSLKQATNEKSNRKSGKLTLNQLIKTQIQIINKLNLNRTSYGTKTE